MLQEDTTTPNLTHADTMTPYYTKIPEKVTLQLPQHQSNQYKNNVINQTATGNITSTTTAYHHHIHSCTQNDVTLPTHPPTNVPSTTASTISYPYKIASTTFPPTENPVQQQNSLLQPNISPQCMLQMTTALPNHASATPNGNTNMTTGSSHM